jgi:YVTN family beta-propeller protein
VIGRIPAGFAPIAMALSPDERLLYATIQQAPDSEGWPAACKPEGQDSATATPEDPEGAVVVIDAARAQADPKNSVIARIPAGCAPVRLARSPSGDTLYVAARGDNALFVFDTAKLITDPEHARIARVPVGTAPVGVAIIDDGRKVVVANSDRFSLGTAGREGLSIIDAAKAASGAPALIGAVRSGAFPRELSITADGKTLLVTNSDSDQLELVDLTQLPVP